MGKGKKRRTGSATHRFELDRRGFASRGLSCRLPPLFCSSVSLRAVGGEGRGRVEMEWFWRFVPAVEGVVVGGRGWDKGSFRRFVDKMNRQPFGWRCQGSKATQYSSVVRS